MNDEIQNAVTTLKRAVLRVLYEAHVSSPAFPSEGMTFNEIHEALVIERIPKTKDYFVHGILLRLWKDDTAERVGRGKWRITEKGIADIVGSGDL